MKSKRKTTSKAKKKELKVKETKSKSKSKKQESSEPIIPSPSTIPCSELTSQYNTLRINCIENIPSSIEDIFTIKEINLLALCRSDNTIEIWTTNTWIQLYKFPGLKNIQTRRVWMTYKNSSNSNYDIFNHLRLFSIGLSGYFIEWDFQTLLPKYEYKNSSAIWDFKIKNKLCLLASYDGKVEIIKIKKNENPYMVKNISTRDNILSICFENSTNNIFYTGHSNGVINKLNLQTGQILLSINTSLNVKNSEEKNMIWTLCSINAQFLFAGDSKGRLLILDMKTGNINQEINEHKGDILTMCFNNNLEKPIIYYSGVDSLIGCIKYNKKNNEFIFTSSFRGQSHDVNTLALLDDDTLLSGGNTTDICIYHLFNGGNLYQKYEKKVNTNIKRHISPFEHRINYHISQANKDKIFFILHQKLDYVDLWNVNMNNQINTFVAKIYKSKKVEGNIICSNLSFDAKIIAISYDKVTIVFNYDFDNNEIKKIGMIKHQANYIFINNKYQIILLSQNENKLFLYDLILNKENPDNNKYNLNEIKSIILPKNSNINLDNILDIKNSITNNQLILYAYYNEKENVLIYSTLSKQLYLIDINKSTNESLPHPDKYITKISFNLDNTKLITIDENNLIYLIDFNSKKFDEWTNQRIKNEDYPINYIKWYNRIFGICALGINKYILYTDYNYILLDLSLEIPKQCIIEKNKMDKYIYSNYEKLVKEYHRILFEKEYKPGNPLVEENKNMFLPTEVRDKSLYNLENNNFKITSRFNSIMYIDLISFIEEKKDGENKGKNKYLLVIENDWNNIIKSFPGALIRHRYGH